MKRIKITNGQSAEELREEIAMLKQKCNDLEQSRQNPLESCRNTLREQKAKIRELEAAGRQLETIHNSILKYLANQAGGEIRVPQDHLRITAEYNHMAYLDEKRMEYVFRSYKEKTDE